MTLFPLESVRMCGYIMIVDMYEMMCVVADYVSIGIHTYAKKVDVFTISLMYRDVTEEKIKARM